MEKKREGRSSDADNKQSVTCRVIILSLDVRVRLYASLPRVTCGIHYVWYVVEFARVSRVYASVCDNTRWLKNTTRPTCRSRKFLLALKTFRRDVLLVDNYARLSFFFFLFFFTPLSESSTSILTIFADIDDDHLLFSPQLCHLTVENTLSFELLRFELDKLFFVKYLDNLRSNNGEMFIISPWYKDSW